MRLRLIAILHQHRLHWALLPAAALILTGCGSNPQQDQAAATRSQEIERLRQENEALPQVQKDNEVVQKLKKENQDLAKLRSQYQEANRLRKENDQLRAQVARISPSAATNSAAGAPTASLPEEEKKAPVDELALNDGDEVMVDPKFLKQIMPDIDWEKLPQKGPVSIRSLMEKDGIPFTNAVQLHDYGITNFVIRRAPPAPPAQPGQPAPDKQN